MTPSRLLSLLALASLASCSRPEPPVADSVPPRPVDRDSGGYLAAGACPFECCMYGRWTVLTSPVLRAAPSARADSVGTLAANTLVTADSGHVRVSPVGLVVVTDTVPAQLLERPLALAVGDTIELLDYEGEGYRNVRWRGQAVTLSEYWDTLGTRGMRLVRPPVQRWWAHVTSGGSRGWILMDSVRVRGADQCAGPV